jgi:hypothetical protein
MVGVRFETTRALDAIERRLATDPLRTGGVVDLAEAVRLADLDGGRPATLIRIGMVIDALSRRLGDSGVALYAVAERGLLSDTDLSSNERMVLRRWADDGLIELIPAGASTLSRVGEIAALTGQMVISRAPMHSHPGPVYVVVPEAGGAGLRPAPSAGPSPRPHPVTSRWWRCPSVGCTSFGGPNTPQSPPAMPSGAPVCPRHGERLIDAGPRPWTVPMAVRVSGVVRRRFVATAGRPVSVGRAPEEGIALAGFMGGDSARWVSRHHLTIDVRDGMLYATDVSTNGSAVLARTGGGQTTRRVTLNRCQPYAMGEWDEVELHAGLTVGRADRPPAAPPSGDDLDSVMVDAPTVAMRLPPEPGR